MSVTIVIPAYNEGKSLPQVLEALKSFAASNGFKIIIVNDGSSDNTSLVINGFADNHILSVLHHKQNRGYGAAIKTGIRAATTPYVITVDADGQHRPEDILNLYNSIRETDADLVVGGRTHQKDASLFRGIGKAIIRLFVRVMIKVSIHDINSGMKIYRTALAQKFIRLAPDTMAFSDIMTISFVYFGCHVLEVPIKINEPRSSERRRQYKSKLSCALPFSLRLEAHELPVGRVVEYRNI